MNLVDFIIIGRGMIGSAVACHIANKGFSVTLIGPSEPKDIKKHQGVFASHYDSSRIFRTLDPVAHNCRMSKESINRGLSLEQRTGIKFLHEVGFLAVSDKNDYLDSISSHAKDYYPNFSTFDNYQLAKRFPYFNFSPKVNAIFQKDNAGWINPRENIKAQNKEFSTLDNALIVKDIVSKVSKNNQYIEVVTSKSVFRCKKCIFSTGAFANIDNIMPRKIQYAVIPHTTVLAEIKSTQLDEIKNMPTMSYRTGDDAYKFIYLLPPVKYPNGKHYIKIGHAIGDEMPIKDKKSIQDWFHSNGDNEKIPWLKEKLITLLPDIKFEKFSSHACITTTSPNTHNYIDQFTEKGFYALLPGGTHSAKSSDEMGRIMSVLATENRFPKHYNSDEFKLIYE